MSDRLLRIVLDTNLIVSAVLTRGGLESRILRLTLNGEFSLYASPPILREYSEVLARAKFRLTRNTQQQIVEGIERAAIVVVPKLHLLVCSDPEDNMFLECSDAAHADYLITGNLRHFPAAWKSTRVVSSRQFLASV
ncbi:MAG: putative toxin-antitoxin system toxin component, PIN family [Acidobacteriaceae bacterium]